MADAEFILIRLLRSLNLKPRQRKILWLKFSRGLSFREIGKEVGLSHTQVVRLYKRALRHVYLIKGRGLLGGR